MSPPRSHVNVACTPRHLGGGVFMNRLILEETWKRLEANGLRVLVPARIPLNDGGIAYGQAAIARARHSESFALRMTAGYHLTRPS